jgi:flagellar M-ring protein FliF
VVGNDNFRIQIAADVDFSKVEETKEALDPNQILRSESSKEDKNSANNTGGVPGSLSNRPPAVSPDKNSKDSASKTATDNSKQTLTERHEYNRQYENSRTVTHTEYPLGRIKQLSVSVLLNQKTAPKTGWNAEQLGEIEELVKRATGFDVARGDQFSLASFDFSPTVVTTVPNEELPWWQQSSLQEMLRYGVGSLLGLALIFFGIRPLVKHLVSLQRAESLSETSSKHTEPTLQTIGSRNSRAAVSDDDINAMLNDVAMQQGDRPTLSDNSPLDLDDLPAVGSDFDMQLQHLQLLVDKETARVTDVIKLWINGNERH